MKAIDRMRTQLEIMQGETIGIAQTYYLDHDDIEGDRKRYAMHLAHTEVRVLLAMLQVKVNAIENILINEDGIM